ncbi:MAG: gamma-glutamyltranspeptidase/glutathione hydrolase [Pseudohongiellaceae bacterium]
MGSTLSTNGGAVAAVERHAATVGATILSQGGNAIDAAVATALALAVTWPPAGNIGGGGLMLVRLADGQDFALDFRETAPAAIQPRLFLDDQGRYDPQRAKDPGLCAGVPGTVAGLHAAHQSWGRLPWRELVAPAVALAAGGFVIDDTLALWISTFADELAAQPFSAAVFLDAEGRPFAAGARLVQADLAATLQRIAEHGPEGFYAGPVAEEIARFLAAQGGPMTMDDLAAYQPVLRRPLHIPFRGQTVLAFGPPSSGGIALGQILGQLSRLGWVAEPLLSASAVHLYAEAARRAFADRATHLGDPAFHTVPLEFLLSGPHLDALALSVDRNAATPSSTLGPEITDEPEHDTTHISVIDRFDNAVSLTTTLEEAFGGKAIAGRTGVLLNDQLRDFNRIPGESRTAGHIGTEPNLAAPGKRPLTSMTPILVINDGHPVLATGSPGGRTIINTVTQVLLSFLDRDLGIEQAVRLPRVHHSWFPDRIVAEPGALSDAVLAELRSLGHVVQIASVHAPLFGTQGCANTVAVDKTSGHRTAVGDPRREGWAAVADLP